MNLRDIFSLINGRAEQGVGYLVTAVKGQSRRQRRSENRRYRMPTRQSLNSRQREAREKKDKHRRRIAEASRRRNRRAA